MPRTREVDGGVVRGLGSRLDADAGPALLVDDLDGLAQFDIPPVGVLLLETVLCDGLDIVPGAAVQDRDFDVVDLHGRVVHAQARQRGKEVLHRVDLDRAVGKRGAAGSVGDEFAQGGKDGVGADVRAHEDDAGVRAGGLQCQMGELAGMEAFSFERIVSFERMLLHCSLIVAKISPQR